MSDLITRAEYLDRSSRAFREGGNEASMREHRAFYAQFVNERTIAHVAGYFSAERLLRSTDEHFNDLPLREWDIMSMSMPMAIKFTTVGDIGSKAGLVCVAKEAARQFVERWSKEEQK